MSISKREAVKVATERLKQAELDPNLILPITALAEAMKKWFTEDELKEIIAAMKGENE